MIFDDALADRQTKAHAPTFFRGEKRAKDMRQQLNFKETEIGIFPREWPLLAVDDIKANDKKAIISGPFGSNISSKYFVESGIPVIRGNNLSTDMTRFIDDSFVFVTPEKAEELGTWAARGDIIFTAAGTLGQVGIIEKDSKYEKYVISNKQLRLRVNNALVGPLFAFYWFSNPEMVRYIEQRNTGSTIPLINLSVLKSLPIIVPPVEIQDGIVEILDSLDKKIVYNQKVNLNLEEIGQAIFKRWFIDFEFPNDNSKPYKSSGGEMVDSELGEIPKGWKVGNFEEIIDITSGKRPNEKSETKNNEYSIPLIGASSVMGFVKESLYDEPIIIIGRVGTHGVVQRVLSPSFPSDNTLVIKSKYYGYSYQTLKMIDYESLNVGTTQPLITQSSIKNMKMIIPVEKLLDEYESVVSKIFIKIDDNNKENEILGLIRDSLLPKLMSGKIRVGMAK